MRDSLLKRFHGFAAAASCSMLLIACGSADEEGPSGAAGATMAGEASRIVSLFAQPPEETPARDPFRLPPVRPTTRSPEAAAPLPILNGIAFASGKKQAFFVLNGERVTASGGDTIGGYLIVEIGNDRVQVKDKKTGKQFYLLPGN